MPSDSGSSRAASGGAFERRKMATARRSRTAATIRSVLRVRLFIGGRQKQRTTCRRGRTVGHLAFLVESEFENLPRFRVDTQNICHIASLLFNSVGDPATKLLTLARCHLKSRMTKAPSGRMKSGVGFRPDGMRDGPDRPAEESLSMFRARAIGIASVVFVLSAAQAAHAGPKFADYPQRKANSASSRRIS